MPSGTFELDDTYDLSILLTLYDLLTIEDPSDMGTALHFYPGLVAVIVEAHDDIRDFLSPGHQCLLCNGALDVWVE